MENTSRTIHNASSVAEKLLYKFINYDHHIHRLSLTQVAPGHVSEILAMDTERVKPGNPELKKWVKYFVSNELIFFNVLDLILF